MALILGGASVLVGYVPRATAADPVGQSPAFLRETATAGSGAAPSATAAASLPAGFQDSVAFSGLTNPTAMAFSPDGRVFVAEKSGLIKVFDGLTDTVPTVFADLQTQVDNYWDRGLLGLALPPNFPTNPYVYVLYTYDAPIGGTAPVWNDGCPSPPGPTTDGCVVSGRLSRLQAAGNVMTGQEQVLINDWCQQYPSHSIGTVMFGPDGALYVGGGDGANFTGADYGQGGGSAGSPTPRNPCGDPPAGVGGIEAPPSAEGGALRSQDVRTLSSVGGTSYAATVLADNPVAYWRLGETSGTIAADEVGSSPGTYSGGSSLGAVGALAGDSNPAVGLAGSFGQRPIVVPQTSALNLGNGPFSLEAWARRSSSGTSDTILDYGYGSPPGGPALEFVNDKISLVGNGQGIIVQETGTTVDANWHHVVATWNGTTGRIYKDGIDVSGPTAIMTLSSQAAGMLIGANQDPGEEYGGGLDEVAIYHTVLTGSRVAAHYNAGITGGGSPSDPTTLDGSVLRLDPDTGAAMAGNPLSGSSDLNARRIIAHGLRNPFRFTIRPGTNELWIGDVGYSTWEEIDLLANPTAGLVNYGWPCYEGVGRESSYDNLDVTLCESLYAAGSGAVAAPYLTYNHAAQVVPGETCPTTTGSSISGLAFYQGGSYPAAYDGGLFFSDYSRDCIWFMPAGGNGRPNTSQLATFVAAAASPVELMIGPGGDLYYVDFDGGSIHRVVYFAGNQPPTAVPVAVPTSGPAPLAVAFDGSGSTDPENGSLTYAWDFDGNGTDDATTAQANHTYTTTGTYAARLRVTDQQGLSDSKTVTISVDNTPPVPSIVSPLASLTWSVGDVIAFSGGASDAEDGAIPASRLSWSIILHHCPTDPNSCHTHPVQTISGVASGSFAAPDHEYPSYLEIVLTATDSGGLQASTSVRIDPSTVVLSFATAPTGLQLTVGSFTGTAPFTRTVIRESRNSLSAPTPQDLGGSQYAWSGWSDGGAQSHDVIASAAASYTATYQATTADVGVGQAAQVTSGQVALNLTVRNAGPLSATGVSLNDPLSAKLTFVTASSSAGSCTYSAGNRTVTCGLGAIASGAQVTVSIFTRNTQKGTVSNTVTVSATTPDPKTANNSSTISIRLR